ncbi:MAG: putative membrane protein [Halioglobus sp.]|jgi:putative membrane protein
MKQLSTILVLFVALSHVAILILEVFFWNHPVGRDAFSMTLQQSQATQVLAMNQGIYNGFLAAGLFWGLWSERIDLKVFFLCCVSVAGIFGAVTAKSSILFTQGMPAMIALAVLYISVRLPQPKRPIEAPSAKN